MLISEIIAEIQLEVGGDSADTTLGTLLLGFMKGALRMLPLGARDRTLVGIETATLAASGQSITLPTGFIKEVSDQSIWYVDGGHREIIQRYQADNFRQIYSTGITGNPSYYRIYGKTMEFDVKSQEARTIYCECFKEVSSILTTDTFFGNDTVLATVKALTKHIYYHDYEEDESRGKAQLAIAQDMMAELDGMYMEEELGSHVEEA